MGNQTTENRAMELSRIMEPELKDNEYCLVLGADMSTFIIMPRELQDRLEANESLQITDTLPAVTVAAGLLNVVLRDHIASILSAKQADNVVRLPLFGPNGKPL